MALIDVVNFNADASCLASAKWLRCLEGGRDSIVMRVLTNYAAHRRKVNLGIVGATARDLAAFNPQAVEFINEHSEVFEIVLRPFAHDNALLRLPAGFRWNAENGIAALRRLFRRVGDFYLAPENMVTGGQIRILRELGVRGIFLHKGRYDVSVNRHVPDVPFELRGVFGTPMLCVPFAAAELEALFLRGLHGMETAEAWGAAARQRSAQGQCVIWRDGESCLLHPLAPRHEEQMFAAEEAAGVERAFLSELRLPRERPALRDGVLRYFPLHSMRPWMEAMKLYWYIGRVQLLEQQLDRQPEPVKRLWLLTINSDILSAAEKSSPVVDVSDEVLRADAGDPLWNGVLPLPESQQLILTRSERAGEGEDYLSYLDEVASGRTSVEALCAAWRESGEPHLRKAAARVCD